MNINKHILLISLLLIGIATDAANLSEKQKSANDEGKSLGLTSSAQYLEGMKNYDPNKEVPGYAKMEKDKADGKVSSPEQYYDSGQDLRDVGYQKSGSDETGKYYAESAKSRAKSNIDPVHDPLFKRQDEIVNKSASLVKNSYSGCVDLPVGTKDIKTETPKSCGVTSSYVKHSAECNTTVTAVCQNGGAYNQAKIEYKTINISSRGRDKLAIEYHMTDHTWEVIAPSDAHLNSPWDGFYSPNSTQKSTLYAVQANFPAMDYDYYCVKNTTTVKSYNESTDWAAWWEGPGLVGSQYADGSGDHSYIDALPTCENNFRVKLREEDGNQGKKYWYDTKYNLGGKFTFVFTVTPKCNPSFTESTSCSVGAGYPDSQLVSSQCLESGVKIINGFSIARPCWNTQKKYEYQELITAPSAECENLKAQGCIYSNSVCLNKSPLGGCLNEQQNFTCFGLKAESSVSLCGSQLICEDGNCSKEIGQTQDTNPEDFKRAAASTAVANELIKTIKPDSIEIFRGERHACKIGSLSNCCTDSGLLNKLNLDGCTQEEKDLAVAIVQGRTHKFDDYQKKSSGVVSGALGAKSTFKPFCVYPSKIARIVAEQGRPQIGFPLGDGKPDSTDCSGFSISQLEQLDFDAIDFKDLYDEVLQRAMNGTTPSAAEALERVSETLKAKSSGATP